MSTFFHNKQTDGSTQMEESAQVVDKYYISSDDDSDSGVCDSLSEIVMFSRKPRKFFHWGHPWSN